MSKIDIYTGEAHEPPNYKLRGCSASFGSVVSSCLVNGVVTIDAYDHSTGRLIHVDFCRPHQTLTGAQEQAYRMRELAATIMREAERLERLLAESRRQAS